MKRRHLLNGAFLCACLLTIVSCSKQEAVYDFRNTNWGMTLDEVKAAEGKPSLEYEYRDELRLIYEGEKVDDLKVDLTYRFNANGELISAQYEQTDFYHDYNDYIDDYERIIKKLTEDYGPPLYNSETWSDDTYKDVTKNLGAEISTGKLSMSSF